MGLASKPQNLTLLLTSIQGFAELTSRQTREEHLRMLETYERLLLPLLREYDGKLVRKLGDSLLAVFGSPTGAVLCGMGMQDRLWRHNQEQPPEGQLHVRICLHAGEVLLSQDTVLGEPMEVVKAAEQVALADEVTFTESVNLARNRAEVTAEPCGTIPLPGRGESLQLYRSKRARHRGPLRSAAGIWANAATQKRSCSRRSSRWPCCERRPWSLATPARARRLVGLGLAAVLLLLAVAGLWLWNRSPEVQARRLLDDGKPAEAIKRLDAAPRKTGRSQRSGRFARWPLHALKRHETTSTTCCWRWRRLGTRAWTPEVLDALAEDFGADESDKGLRKLLGSLPKDRLHSPSSRWPKAPPHRSSGARCATWRPRRTRRAWTW